METVGPTTSPRTSPRVITAGRRAGTVRGAQKVARVGSGKRAGAPQAELPAIVTDTRGSEPRTSRSPRIRAANVVKTTPVEGREGGAEGGKPQPDRSPAAVALSDQATQRKPRRPGPGDAVAVPIHPEGNGPPARLAGGHKRPGRRQRSQVIRVFRVCAAAKRTFPINRVPV